MDVTPFVFPDEVGGLPVESSDEWQEFATVLDAHQPLQHGIPRHKIERSYAVDGEKGGLSITISQMLQDVCHTLTTGACCQGRLPWCCGHLNLFGNLLRNCLAMSLRCLARHGFSQCYDASQPYSLLNPVKNLTRSHDMRELMENCNITIALQEWPEVLCGHA